MIFNGIRQAALTIALDNGRINRDRPLEQFDRDFKKWIDKRTDVLDLLFIDKWLEGLSFAEMETVCCGGQDEDETQELMKKAPKGTNGLLNDYFDEVC
jgi:hypothetical protein